MPEPVTYLINFGALGVVLVLVLLGKLWPSPAVQREQQAREKAEAQRDALIKTIEEQVIPVLDVTATKVVPALQENRELLRELRRDVEEIRRSLP